MRAWWVALGCWPLACAQAPARTQAPVDSVHVEMPGPARNRGAAAVTLNRECERCHPSEAAEWRTSLHQRSELEPAYQRSFAIEPMPFCRSCHAPEADPRLPTPPAVAELGVGCVSCHLDPSGAVLSVPRSDPRAAPHPVARDPRFAEAPACAGCHEFAFPATLARGRGALMQATASEHLESPFADTSCASCHMPLADGRRRHDFTASRSTDVLRGSLRAEAKRLSDGAVVIELQSVGVGHAFPTGDLFRRLEVSLEAVGADENSLAQDVVWLQRHFAPGTGQGRVLIGDDRLFDEPRRVELDVGDAGVGRPLVWRVAYQRVAQPGGANAAAATLEDDVPLAWGRLPPLAPLEIP